MIFKILSLFLIFFSLSANPIVTENDPSTLVEGVSVITGDFYTFEEDLVVPGAEPIRFQRAYVHSIGHVNQLPHLNAHWISGFFTVNEPNGTPVCYRHKKDNRFVVSLPSTKSGVTNTASGRISARTNLKNQYLEIGEKNKYFTLYAANGAKRQYRTLKSQKKVDLPYGGGKGYLIRFYRLENENLPNGNKIEYTWNDQDELIAIETKSCRSKSFAKANISHFNAKTPSTPATVKASFNKKLTLKQRPLDKCYVLDTIESSNLPDQTFHYEMHENKPVLNSISLPNGRELQIAYENSKVKTLSSRAGPTDDLIVTHTFFYEPNQKRSWVIDAAGNKTAYTWNSDFRLTSIQKFIGENALDSEERFEWQDSQIRSKALLDAHGKLLAKREFFYDERGNVLEEIFSGIDGERAVKKTRYQNDLPTYQEENGIVSTWEYIPNTNLIRSARIADVHTNYEYDEDLLLIQETIDDGVAKLVKKITPFKDGPLFGLPQSVEELGKKTIFHYGEDGLVKKRDIYDAAGKFCYAAHTEHDEKGRVTKEINALGQESIYSYDALGNCIYSKTLEKETSLQYDYATASSKKMKQGKLPTMLMIRATI